MATLGTKLSKLRKEKNVTLEKLSDEINISKTAIGKWEADKAKPSIENLLKICDFFQIDMYDLLQDASNINQSHAKFKGHSCAGYAQNFTVNNAISPELLTSLLENQQKITSLFEQQNKLLKSITEK